MKRLINFAVGAGLYNVSFYKSIHNVLLCYTADERLDLACFCTNSDSPLIGKGERSYAA